MAPLLWLGAALAAGYSGYKAFFEEKERFLGDKAKVGDGVQAPIANFLPINPGIAANVFPSGAGFIFFQVEREDKDNVYGPAVGTNLGPLPKQVRPSDVGLPSNGFAVPRSIITMISRGGKTATATSAGFHGETRLPRVFQG